MFSRFLNDIDNYSSDAGFYLDVPYVPSEENVVDTMLEMANVGSKDVLYDLGSGDGRILVAAAKAWGTRGVGIDIDPMRIAEAMEYAGWSQVEDLVDFVEDDIFTANFSEATAITLYLLQSINEQLRPRILSELRPGTRVISHAFDMGDWKADETRKIDSVNIYKWIVPANVAGVWEWERSGQCYRLDLQQKYQNVTGDAWVNDSPVQLKKANLRGRRLSVELEDDKEDCLGKFTLEFADNRIRTVIADMQKSASVDRTQR